MTDLDHGAIRAGVYDALTDADINGSIYGGILASMPNGEAILNAIADGVKEAVSDYLKRNGLPEVRP